MSDNDEKRHFPRTEMKGKLRYRVPEQMEISLASIKNISEGGLCLLTEAEHGAGQKLSLEFGLPGDPRPILGTGVVRWVELLDIPQGKFNFRVGIQFEEIDDERREEIRKFIVKRLRKQIHDEVAGGEGQKDAPPSGEKLTILVIDDDRVTLNLVREVFSEEFNVLTAQDGFTGVEKAKEWKPDIILLDIIMPDMDGFSTLMMLKDFAETAEIPVIMLSVVRDKNKVFQAIQHGARDYMIKPFTSETLLDKIRKHGLGI